LVFDKNSRRFSLPEGEEQAVFDITQQTIEHDSVFTPGLTL